MKKLISALLCVLLSGQANSLALLGQNPDSEGSRCAWHLETLSPDFDPRDAHTFSIPPAKAKNVATLPLEASAKIIFAAPTTALDVRRLYPRSKHITAADMSETNSNLKALKTFGQGGPDRSIGKKNFSKVLSSASESYIVLVGHNEGGQFHFLDGSTMDMEDIADECAKLHKVPVLISCKSVSEKAVGSKRDLTFAEAFCIAGRLKTFLGNAAQSHQKVAPASLQGAFSSSESSFACNATVRFFVLAGCGLGIAFAIAISEADKKAS